MAKPSAVRVTPSTGNVFRDLGFPNEEAEHLLVRADLLIQVQKVITAKVLTQAQAAKLLRVTQPRVSDLLRGRIVCSAPTRLSTCWRVWAWACAWW